MIMVSVMVIKLLVEYDFQEGRVIYDDYDEFDEE